MSSEIETEKPGRIVRSPEAVICVWLFVMMKWLVAV
jgi:hypothetical protein